VRRLVWFLLVSFVSAGSCSQSAERLPAARAEGGGKSLKGKKVVMIIANRKFRDEELGRPREVLTKAGAKVVVAAATTQTAVGMLGGRAKPDIPLSAVKVADYDAVIFVGGAGASVYWNNPTAHKIAREAVKKGKILGAICIAPVTLANAGVLRGKKATVFPSVAKFLKAKGAVYTGRGVERDGKIITANGPKNARAFGLAIAKALAE